MSGKGTFTWPDGRVYVGFFANDKIYDQKYNAESKMTWPDGAFY